MLFNSFAFLAFFAVLAVLYYAVPSRFRWLLLLVASYYFYSTFQLVYMLLLAYATAVAYVAGIAVARDDPNRRMILAVAIVAELAVLVLFKYADFLLGSVESVLAPLTDPAQRIALPRLEWILPAGLSFFTFSCISYIVDCYRGTIAPERHAGRLAVYVAFFPKLIAGPIERATAFLPQLSAGVRFDPLTVTFGLQLLLWGLFKKVVIADRLADFVNTGFTNPDFQSPVALLIAVYFYAFQIYCDFSGYSDIAIGMAAILGFQLRENFRRPYLSRSIAEFWGQRWHISLANWFRDYLYIPLGGNRVSRQRWYVNQMTVFLISGIWHGANWTFLVWGGLNGLYQVLYYMLGGARSRTASVLPAWLWSVAGILLTFHLVLVSWVFFRADSIAQAWKILTKLGAAASNFPMLLAAYNWTTGFWLSLGLIVFLILVEILDEFRSLWGWLAERPTALRWGFYYAVLGSLLVVGQWNMGQFVYMQF